MQLADTYEPDLDYIDEGDVVDVRGKRLRLSALIKRRWGWGRRAANDAAEVLRAQANGRPVRLWLTQPKRGKQQAGLFGIDPGLVRAICDGLALSSADDSLADSHIRYIVIKLKDSIIDEGLSSDVINVVAHHLGCTAVELREKWARIELADMHLTVTVDNEAMVAGG